MGAAVEDIEEGDREDIWLLSAGQLSDVDVERYVLFGSGGLGDGHGDTEDSIGTKLALVLGAIELIQEVVDGALILDINVLLDKSRCNGVVDILDCLEDTWKREMRAK